MQIIVFAVIRITWYNRLSEHYDIDTLPIVIGLKSISFNNAIVVALTVCGTLILDQLIGMIWKWNAGTTKESFINLFILVVLFVFDMVTMFYAIPAGDFLYVALLPSLHQGVLICTTMMYIMVYGGETWRVYVTVVLISLGAASRSFSLLSSPNSNLWHNCSKAFIYTGAAWFYFLSCRWFWHLWKLSKDTKLSSQQYVCSLYVLSLVINMLARVIKSIISYPKTIDEFDLLTIFSDSILNSVLILFLFLLQKHFLRRELTITEVSPAILLALRS
jgi:hypothetical protein